MEKIKLTNKRKEIVELMNFDSIMSVLRYYPNRYEIYKNDVLSMSLHDKKVTFEGNIVSNILVEKINNNRRKISFRLANKTNDVLVVMFNSSAITKFLFINTHLVVNGKYNAFKNEIVVSKYLLDTLGNKEKIVPVYSLNSNIKEITYKKFVMYIYDMAILNNCIIDIVPNDLIKKYRLVTLKEALYSIHNPEDSNKLHQALRYLKYEEFLSFCTIGFLKRQMTSSSINKSKIIDYEYLRKFIYELPFKLTNDQKNALKEILDDLKKPQSMSRLLQGDVGSGKTIVAIISLLANYSANYQSAFMVPTDILAKQHYQTIKSLFTNLDVKIGLLVSDMPLKEKNKTLEELENGKINIIIGTHSLIQNNVVYNNLGLAIIDEQHRFGVRQRLALKEKGVAIDVLYMSATPIPRTLASTIYLDMDVSTIATYPYKNRQIITKFINKNSIKEDKKIIENYLKSKQQIYVVCPSIEDSSLDILNAKKIYNSYQKVFKDYQVGLMHGKLSTMQKNQIMDDFETGKIQILVATTVIEVGINVKNANMMIIYNAERFGLAQIHQLRGRVARDGSKGYCYLLSNSMDEDVVSRLKFISLNNDGFEISKYDLQRRGQGDMLGINQSGKSPFSIANIIDDFNILKVAREDAKNILDNCEKYDDYLNKIKDIIHNEKKYVD